jgi:hypothetical protein
MREMSADRARTDRTDTEDPCRICLVLHHELVIMEARPACLWLGLCPSTRVTRGRQKRRSRRELRDSSTSG